MHEPNAPKDYGSVVPPKAFQGKSLNNKSSDVIKEQFVPSVSSSQSTQGSDTSSPSSITRSCYLVDESIAYEVSHNYFIPLKDSLAPRVAPSSGMSISYMKRALRKSSDVILHSLGFYRNPVLASSEGSISSIASTTTTETSSLLSLRVLPQEATQSTDRVVKVAKRNSSYADMQLSMVSNFSAAYNTVNISLGLTLMKPLHPPIHPSDVSICSSALIAGMIIGQLGGGLLGDWLGRHMAMSVVMSLQVASAFWSAWVGLLGVSESVGIYHVLAGCRFLLGIGCGGVYPLAATLTAESSTQEEDRGKLVALTFSMQGVGYLIVSLTAYALLLLLGEESNLAWRLLLGFGCLPGLGLIVIRTFHRSSVVTKNTTRTNESKDVETTRENEQANLDDVTSSNQKSVNAVRLPPSSLFQQIRNESDLLSKILGTAGCWLMFDILFYGNTLFQPIVFAAAFGESETILSLVRDSTVISLIALPGYFVSVYMVGKQTPKRIQLQGFLIMAMLYAIIGIKFSSLASHRCALMALYGLTFFFSNYGPNTTTFMMPSITFSRPCRSTLNGICAASGKAGALLGSIIFLPLATWLGNDKVMIACSSVSVIAAVMTLFLEDSSGELPIKKISSEAHLLTLSDEDDQVPKLIKTGSMPCIFDQYRHLSGPECF
ncbi:hypothetical protein HJC23_003845 [Cyclotella cryptica]|uniref:Major facilitator superfamily (MFS) profile domain-containing protein n=1 Tax=Cyclotella cryptica TaxID=29204 RepID=A0ABD3Q506_9STRA|eukprot:CCRYP_009997-RA/>CCRYP_009997-RA protein AED:0.33 eAED:0.33 QI:274/1/0.5/1/1/1/2/0/660